MKTVSSIKKESLQSTGKTKMEGKRMFQSISKKRWHCYVLAVALLLMLVPAAGMAAWNSSTIYSNADYLWVNSLAVDRDDQPHVSFLAFYPGGQLIAYGWRSNYDSSTWQRYGFDGISNRRRVGNAIATDSMSYRHVVYAGNSLKLYRSPYDNSAMGKTSTLVGNSTRNPSIAIDSLDQIHIVYYDELTKAYTYLLTNRDHQVMARRILKYDECTRDSYSCIDFAPSIAVDSGNNVHVAFGHTQEGLLYFRRASGLSKVYSWTEDTVENDCASYQTYSGRTISTCRGPFNTSIAVDSNGKVHLVHDTKNGFLRGDNLAYTTNADGPWNTMLLGEPTARGRSNLSSAIAIDSWDEVHIAYVDRNQVVYATNPTGTWHFEYETVYETGSCPGCYGPLSTRIAVDSMDDVHITFSHEENYVDKLKHAEKASWHYRQKKSYSPFRLIR